MRSGMDPNDPAYSRAAHGSNSPCYECPPRRGKPRYCNQERGQGLPRRAVVTNARNLVW